MKIKSPKPKPALITLTLEEFRNQIVIARMTGMQIARLNQRKARR